MFSCSFIYPVLSRYPSLLLRDPPSSHLIRLLSPLTFATKTLRPSPRTLTAALSQAVGISRLSALLRTEGPATDALGTRRYARLLLC